MRVLVTGDAGFIGFHVSRMLLDAGHTVVGLDSMNPYYDVTLKERRLALLVDRPKFRHETLLLEDQPGVLRIFADFRPELVIHLAAQAGVRHSIDNPSAYIGANILGSFAILEACRMHPVQHLLLASTSSAYGANEKYPFVETDNAIHPITLYAATKGSMELMAHAYAHLFAIPTTAFRFFTVYGPWGRPDMAYYIFTRKIIAGEPIELFNNGKSWRDFTYIDDLANSILRLAACIPPAADTRHDREAIPGDSLSPVAPYRLVNIGAGQPEELTALVDHLETALGIEAKRVLKPLPPGDVVRTFADANLLLALTGSRPQTPLAIGIPEFVRWYRQNIN
ncbi:WcaG Nucleoside-diphosphate-sugar epimerases [Rhabdaerophilaceae bacterium]